MADTPEKSTKGYSRSDLEAIAHQVAVRNGLDPTLVKAVIDQETGGTWNPKAVSPAGARGLMQLMPKTAAGLGVKDSFDPVENIDGGVRYLKQQIQRFGDVGLALAAYNWGPGNASKLQYDPRSVRIPDETQKYVPGVIGRMAKFGDSIIPSSTTAALFPKVGTALVDTIKGKVAIRAGASVSPQDVERELKMLANRAPQPPAAGPVMQASDQPIPTGASDLMPVSAPGGQPSGGAPMLQAEAGGGAPEASQNPLALLSAGAGNVRAQTQNLDQFLRARFGPLADVADPFPKTYDHDLQSLIDRA